KEEIFGPVLSVVRAYDYKEALALPSDHDYVNGVAIFTRDGDAARDFAAKVNVGMVDFTVTIPETFAYYTFVCWKRSGFGVLNHDRIAVRDMARHFAAERVAPFALQWDEEKFFPIDVMREAAALGIGGIYIGNDVGGSGMTRFDAALVFEALAQGCPTVSAF